MMICVGRTKRGLQEQPAGCRSRREVGEGGEAGLEGEGDEGCGEREQLERRWELEVLGQGERLWGVGC